MWRYLHGSIMTHAAPAPDQVTRLQHRVEALERERKQLLALLDIFTEISAPSPTSASRSSSSAIGRSQH